MCAHQRSRDREATEAYLPFSMWQGIEGVQKMYKKEASLMIAVTFAPIWTSYQHHEDAPFNFCHSTYSLPPGKKQKYLLFPHTLDSH